jgi:predicted lipoprotein with Yx(FWY)xxD motif
MEKTMRNTATAILAILLGLTLAGCNRHKTPDTTAEGTPIDTTAPPPEPMPSTPEPEPPASGTLVVGGSGDNVYVTDSSGRALYALKDDDTGTKCEGDCLSAWPMVTNVSVAGVPEIQGPMISQTTRPDGTTQVTYFGHPLYYFANDTGPGMTAGMNVTDQWGTWYLVRPSGETFVMAQDAASAASPGDNAGKK